MKDHTLDILLIEDEMNSSLFADRLKNEFREDINVLSNGHGISNDIETYKDRDIDLVVVDHQYAKEDIVDIVKKIKKRRPYTEVIVLSSDPNEKIKSNLLSAGANNYIYKDQNTIEKLVFMIREVISRKDLKMQNIDLRDKAKKSNVTNWVLILLVLLIIGFVAYLLLS
jgi:DNA-binding NarL/FixJ family response regulator